MVNSLILTKPFILEKFCLTPKIKKDLKNPFENEIKSEEKKNFLENKLKKLKQIQLSTIEKKLVSISLNKKKDVKFIFLFYFIVK